MPASRPGIGVSGLSRRRPDVCSSTRDIHGLVGRGYDQFTDAQREAVIAAFPRETRFKHGIIGAFYQGMKHRPDSTFGTFNDDVLAFKEPNFRRIDMCSVILASKWSS